MNGSRRIRNYFIFEPCVQGEFMCTNQDGNGQLVMADTYVWNCGLCNDRLTCRSLSINGMLANKLSRIILPNQ